jgi:hypothetical protein
MQTLVAIILAAVCLQVQPPNTPPDQKKDVINKDVSNKPNRPDGIDIGGKEIAKAIDLASERLEKAALHIAKQAPKDFGDQAQVTVDTWTLTGGILIGMVLCAVLTAGIALGLALSVIWSLRAPPATFVEDVPSSL